MSNGTFFSVKKMVNTILGTKLTQEQRFTSQGQRIPVTLIQAGPCVVVSKKTEQKDGYIGLQLGFGKAKKVKKALEGQIKKAKLKIAPRFLAEVRLEKEEEVAVGDEVYLEDVLKPGDLVSITGVSKGKGFAGVVRRWGFAGGPRTHGQSDRERAPGSIGATTTPGRVLKGKKMAGRMGGGRVTIKGLRVMQVTPGENLLTVSGLVPGARGGLLFIKKEGEAKNFDPLFAPEEKKKEKPKAKRVKEEKKVLTKKIRVKRRKAKGA